MIIMKTLYKMLILELILQIINRPLPKIKNKKVIGLMKDKLVEKSWENLLEQEQNLIVT